MPLDDDPLLTHQESAARLRKPVATLTDWRYRRTGPDYIRMGRSIYYRRSALDRWVETHTIRPGSS